MTTSDTNGAAAVPKEILPKSLIISRDGFLQVTRKAAVVDSEKLYFTVPKKQMQRVVDSLQVFDSRGNIPCITFPSSFFSSADNFNLRSENAWEDLVTEQQGAFVQVSMGDDCTEGHLIGLRHHGAGDAEKTSVLLLRDAKVSAHNIDNVTSISFRESRASAELKKFTTSKGFDLDTKGNYSITIVTSGSGPGEVSVSYTQIVSGAPFGTSYVISPADGAPSYGIHRNMRIKCFVTIRNPLSCDIEDVEVTIQSQMFQNFPKTNMYSKEQGSGDEGQAMDSDASSAKNEPERDEEDGSGSSELSDIDNLFKNGSTTTSQASIEAYYNSHRAVLATTKLSLKEGGCARIALFEEHCESGLIHYYRAGIDQCFLDLYVRNTTSRHLEPGYGLFSSPDIESTHSFTLKFLMKGERILNTLRRYTGCRGSATSTSSMERVISCSKVDEKLLATVMFRRTAQYVLHNLEDQDIDVFVFHDTAQSSRTEVESEALWYHNLKTVGGGEQKGKATVIQPRPSDMRSLTDYHVHVASKERCRLVVTEYVKKDVEVPLLYNVSMKLIANLEKNDMIGKKLVDGLLDVLRIEREIEFLTRRRGSHRKRLKALINHQRNEAERHEEKPGENVPKLDEGLDYEGVLSTYMRVVARSETEIKKIQEVLDDIDYRLISLQHELKLKKKTLIEKESLD